MMIYEFHPLAAKELGEAVDHYESMAPGKGVELARQVKESIQLICEFPKSAPIARGNVRSVLIQPSARWHFTLHYRIKPDGIRILAFAHQNRSPFYWLRRM